MDHLHDANLLERALVDKANQSRVPITTNFELTPTCTLNCDMCFIRAAAGADKEDKLAVLDAQGDAPQCGGAAFVFFFNVAQPYHASSLVLGRFGPDPAYFLFYYSAARAGWQQTIM